MQRLESSLGLAFVNPKSQIQNQELVSGGRELRDRGAACCPPLLTLGMKTPQTVTLLTVGSTLSLSAMATGAQATPTGTAADLLPVQPRGYAIAPVPDVVAQTKAAKLTTSSTLRPEVYHHPDRLAAVASAINQASQPSATEAVPDISDVIDLSFVEQFVDEDGEVRLPLGITVYEAMGTPSIGFGGKF